MARRKDYDKSPRPFEFADSTVKPVPKGPPQARLRQQIINDPEARTLTGKIFHELRKSWYQPKVNNNKELQDRLDQYFGMVEERQIPPTVEQMALWCGTTTQTFADWRHGKTKLDDGGAGVSTSWLIQKAINLIATYDAVMVQSNKMNTVGYIWRSKQYYGMADKQEVVITNGSEQQEMSREEIEQIARNLPDGSIPTQADIK